MPIKTFSITLDNIGPGAITAPVPCRKITLRESASVVNPQAYTVQSPTSADVAYTKYSSEPTIFEAAQGAYFALNAVVGYIVTAIGSTTFLGICE